MRTNANARGSPRIRLISSFAMLILVIAGVSFYSMRKTSDLFGIGVDAHVHCAMDVAGGLGAPFAPMLQPVLDAAGADYTLVSARPCSVTGRAYSQIILRRGQTLVSVILTQRGDQEVFPKVLAGRVYHAAGIPVHEGTRDGYSVAAFESGAYLGYIVSALPAQQNGEIAGRLAPVIALYTKT